MRKRIWLWLSLWAVISLAGTLPAHTTAQGPWPPVSVEVKPVVAGNSITFEVKVTSLADWTLTDFTLKGSIPAGTSFVEGHADFDGAVTSFDGQDLSFFVIALPASATLGFRYTVHLTNGSRQVHLPELWVGWKGRLPGQYLFTRDTQMVDTSAPQQPQDDGQLAQAIARGLRVIQAHGSAYEQGRERGQALAEEIRTQVEAQLAAVLPLAYDGSRTKWLDAIHQTVSQVDPELMDELRGMAEGSGVPLADLEIANFSSYVVPGETAGSSPTASSIVAATNAPTGTSDLVIGKHQDSDSFTAPNVFLVRHFDDRRPPRLELTQPASVQMSAAVTGNGLFWAGHAVPSKEVAPAGAADPLSAIWGALRKSRTFDELQAQLLAQPRLQPMSMTIASLPQKQVRLIEASTTRSSVSRPDANGLLVSTNHFVSPDLRDLQPPPVNRSQARYDRLISLAQAEESGSDPEKMRTYLHDPQIFDGTGFTIVIDAANMHISYWDDLLGEWLDLPISDLLNT